MSFLLKTQKKKKKKKRRELFDDTILLKEEELKECAQCSACPQNEWAAILGGATNKLYPEVLRYAKTLVFFESTGLLSK